ncbi:hypothetical protein [Leptolyngbya ohadii]|uniref:hypothetical protein n=1 Tax=Leptolyngbya ohadii TaxID=1962290 RepID=UPI0015C5D28A|nr:hypothetical protein [Leptolyngbya ohadii]
MVESLFEFSRTHCIAICAFLVPANLLATLQAMIFTGIGRPIFQVGIMSAAALGYATLMLIHVISWWAIGVVMLPTYILPALAGVCLAINLICLLISATHFRPEIPWIDRRESFAVAWFLRQIGMV